MYVQVLSVLHPDTKKLGLAEGVHREDREGLHGLLQQCLADPSLSIPDPNWEPEGSALASSLLPGPALLSGLRDPETLWQSVLPGTVGLWGPGAGSPRGHH